MFRIIIFFLVTTLLLLGSKSIETELGINIGVNSTKNRDGNRFQNPSLGLIYQDNRYIISPRVEIDYTKVNNDYANGVVKGSINGVYEYENSTNTTPYAVVGVGYEYVFGATKEVFESNAFIQGGAGLKVDLEEGLKARFEGKVLQIIGGNDEGNEFMLTAGVSMPFDITDPLANPFKDKKNSRKPKVIKRVYRRPVPKTPRRGGGEYKMVNGRKVFVVHVENNECPIKIAQPDMDRDGVPNTIDQCPSTPCNFTVDNYGCPVKTRLEINFKTNSAYIEPKYLGKVYHFADFLLRNKGSLVHIVGHTDSKGSAQHNIELSYKRANAVMQALIVRGVSPARLKAFGRGESQPIATNKTAAGRALNRRIEAELFYPKGIR